MIINYKKGLTIIEVLIGIFIIISITTVVFMNFSNFRNEQSLKNTEADIISLLNKARQNTLSSKNSTNYGVHFLSDRVVLFTGLTYTENAITNETVLFNSPVVVKEIGGINLGGGSDVIFERLTGETIGGNVIIELSNDVSKYKTIVINKTGIIYSN